MGLWAGFGKRVNGSEGASGPNRYKRCGHNSHIVLCGTLI